MTIKRNIKSENKYIYQYRNGQYLPDGSQPHPIELGKYTPHDSTRYINVELTNLDYNCKDLIRKALPELYAHREHCCGCTACYATCPMSGSDRPDKAKKTDKLGQSLIINCVISADGRLTKSYEHTGAITMLPDEEGFLYPVVDASACIRCYKCVSVCAFNDKRNGSLRGIGFL